MRIEIDQSGKIEDTSKDTVIAFSDDSFGGIIIKARDKREIQKIFRKIGKRKIFIYRLFAILIFLLIKKHLKKISQMIVDFEICSKIKNRAFGECLSPRTNRGGSASSPTTIIITNQKTLSTLLEV